MLEAAAREALEELGVAVDPADLQFLTVEHRTGNGAAIDERVDFFFACDRWSGDPALQEDKAADLRWFPLAALPDPVVPHERIVLDRLRTGSLDPVTPVGF
ncbi:NUDIX domain-containing protein [Microbacterium sp. NPDC003461]